MKILVVTNMYPEPDAPLLGSYVREQVEPLRQRGHEVSVLHLRTYRGRWRYATGVLQVASWVARMRPDLIHAHYGFSGLVAAGAPGVPLVVTYHGSDVMIPWQRRISRMSARLARVNVCVSERLANTLDPPRARVVPCGVDVEVFRPRNRDEALERLGWRPGRRRILFSGARANPVKDWPLFQAAVNRVDGAEGVALEGYTREEVSWVMAACDAMAITSRYEGGPIVLKEALACGLPVVSVPVGDAEHRLAGLASCRVADREPSALAEALETVLAAAPETRRSLLSTELSLEGVAQSLEDVYRDVLSGREVR